MNYTAHYDSPLGGITLASDGVALTGLWFEWQKHFAAMLDPQHRECDDLSVFAETKRWLDSYFRGQIPDFTPKLAMRATPFRQAIWEILLTIPYGKTVTYGEIARQYIEMCYGSSLPKHHMSAQAVGGAVGHNPIAIIIPCHRVIGANGSLTGYAGGVERKKYLLELERGFKNSVFLPFDITRTMEHRTIRKVSLPADAERVMEVFAAGKAIMVKSGNLNQWINGYPSLEVVQSDMEKGGGFVVEDNGQIVAYFAFLPSPEPTYSKIYEGEWLDDTQPYHVIHRIASFPEVHGIFKSIMEFCFAHEHNIRIDTHCDNHIMQHNILKHGFQYCGIILLANGDERLAYQKMI